MIPIEGYHESDIENLIEKYLEKNLSIETSRRNPYSNEIIVKLCLKGNCISQDSFEMDPNDRRDY